MFYQKKTFVRLIGIFLCALPIFGMEMASAAIFDGVQWLESQQQDDGSIAGPNHSASRFVATSESLNTLLVLEELGTSDINTSLASEFLLNAGAGMTHHLGWRLRLSGVTGDPPENLSTEIGSRTRPGGGFAPVEDFDASVLDTAEALEAFAVAEVGDPQAVSAALSYLQSEQNPDGGYSIGRANESSVFVTAKVLSALAAFRNAYSDLDSTISQAETFLLGSVGDDGTWGEDFVNAQAVIALAKTAPDPVSTLSDSIQLLRDNQRQDGSWREDTYTTALALRALKTIDALGDAGGDKGTITGRFVLEGTEQPVSGVAVAVESGAELSSRADATGAFRLAGIPAGSYTLVASRSGFASRGIAVDIGEGSHLDIGTIALAPLEGRGVLRFFVKDGVKGLPLEGATVFLEGLGQAELTMPASGELDSPGLQAGEYQYEVRANGYHSAFGSVQVPGGDTKRVVISLVSEETPLDDEPGSLFGQVVDGKTHDPIQGARISIEEGGTSLDSNAEGRFTFEDVSRGTHVISVTGDGYGPASVTVNFPAGASGDIGEIPLYPESGQLAPESLTLNLTVLDRVSGDPVSGAMVEIPDHGISDSTGENGDAFLAGIPAKTFDIEVSAEGYGGATGTVEASAFGEYTDSVHLDPLGDPNADTVTVNGIVTDGVTGEPVAQAVITASTGLQSESGSSGFYEIPDIGVKEFTLDIQADGYRAASVPVSVTEFGIYEVDVSLDPYGNKNVTVDSADAPDVPVEPDTTAGISAQVANRSSQGQSVLIIGEIRRADGTRIADISPVDPVSGEVKAEFTLSANETVAVTLPWSVQQAPAGTHLAVVRLVEPGSITRENPRGTQIDEATDRIEVVASKKITGRFDLAPPLIQAGSETPVELGAILRNVGNVALDPAEYELTVVDPEEGSVLVTKSASLGVVGVNEIRHLDYGTWVPESAGDFDVVVTNMDVPEAGSIEGSVYVGNKATGTFTVSPSEVPEGTQTVHGSIELSGVDVTTGTSTDPLFELVRKAVTDGGEYVAPSAVQWHKRSRCLGCHIQTQSAFGMSSSLEKADIDESVTQQLLNYISSSQQSDGGLRMSHPYHTRNQTALGLWALTSSPHQESLYGTELSALRHLLNRRSENNETAYWNTDHGTGWLHNRESITAITMQAASRMLDTRPDIQESVEPLYETQESIPVEVDGHSRMYDAVVFNRALYIVGYGGLVVRHDLESGQSKILPGTGGKSGLGRSIAIDGDGTLYVVGDFSSLITIDPAGIQSEVPLPRGYDYYGVAVDRAGRVYLSREDSTLLRMSTSGELSVLHAGEPLQTPRDLEFAENGSLLIANWGGYGILEWREGEGVAHRVKGMAYRPINLLPRSDGSTLATHGRYYQTSEWSNTGLLSVSESGVVRRHFEESRFFAIAESDGIIYAPFYSQDKIEVIRGIDPDFPALDEFLGKVPKIANFALEKAYQDSNENLVNAFRLVILAEANAYIADEKTKADIGEAIEHIEELLRARQEINGGWSRYSSWNRSDPLTTAWVGIALEYTNPSAEDEVVRDAIAFLLNTQRSDGSWPNISGYFSTRLASTSLVMAYLPEALERLGGLDVELDVEFPADVVAGGFTVAPSSESGLPEGGATYGWDLDGVTASGQQIEFDLSLQDMELFEERAAAEAATLTFKNSFTEEAITTPIQIPSIRAASSIVLDGSTDRQVYSANQPVQIAATVTNTGPEFQGGELRFTIVNAGSGQVIADLASRDVGVLAHGEQIALPNEWNTGTHPATDYLVELRLYDAQDRLRARKDLPFAIEVTGTLAESDIWTDRPVYEAWDEVQVTGRAINGSVNANLPSTLARIAVEGPEGSALLEKSYAVRQLAPGAHQNLPDELTLDDAPAGEYSARIRVFDATGQELLSESSATFAVQRTALQAITGEVSASAARVYQGDPITCTETVTNRSSGVDVDLEVVSELVFMDDEEVVNSESRPVALPAGGADSRGREITTDELRIGGYACRLLARVENGSEKLLDYDLFTVLEPPIEIDASFSQPVGKGRVLVLLDPQGRFLDAESCTGIRRIDLAHQFNSAVAGDSKIEVQLSGSGGEMLDSESASAGVTAVDYSPGRSEGNLSIAEFSEDHVRLVIEGEDLSIGSYGVQATLSSDEGASAELGSGDVAPDCTFGDQLGATFGDLALVAVHGSPPLATDEPYGPKSAPTLESQRVWLEEVLGAAGWSYTIVESADAFERELRSGAYRAYALFFESTKLGSGLQKEIREAVYRGEGLLVAGPHDDRNHFVFEPLGVDQQGRHPDLDLMTVLDSPIQDAVQVPLRLDEKPERIRLEGASVAARFEGVNGNGQSDVAETYFPFGQGVGIYGAFDLLIQGAEDGPAGPYADLLLDALSYAYPVTEPAVGHPVPISLTLVNQGIAVDGRVLFTLPSESELLDSSAQLQVVEGAPAWLFGLGEGATEQLTLWLTAPAEPRDLAATVQVLDEGQYEVYESLSMPLPIGGEVGTEVVTAALQDLADQYKPLKHIVRDFERGLADYEAGNFAGALDTWLRIADRIQQHAGPDAGLEARVGLSRMIRRAEMRL